MSCLLDIQVSPVDRAYQLSVCKATNGTVGTRTGASMMSAAAASKSVYFTKHYYQVLLDV